MRRMLLLAVVCLLAAHGTGWAIGEAGEMPGAVIVQKDRNILNWTQDYIESTGTAVAPEGMKGAQAKALARRGAVVDLQRNLLQFMGGVRVDARTTMNDFMANDTVRSEVNGIIKNVELLDGEWDGEAYIISGRIQMLPLRNIVAANTVPKPSSAPASERKAAPARTTAGRYTGLIIDVRHLPLVPAMTFEVTDTKGRLVYGIGSVDQKHYLQSGFCAYHDNINFAKGELRVATNPIVTKAVRLAHGNVDIVIPEADAAKVLGSSYDFRKECKVIVVSK